MQLDQMSANIRNRTPWEGGDLGFAMARQWFWPLWRLWWFTALPVMVLLMLLLHEWPLLGAALVWWLKPLYEPLLLFWLSRRLFGEDLTVREAFGQWRRIILPRLFSNLTLRRFSPNRSFHMPVSHLEGLRRKERTKRLDVLSGDSSTGIWLTIVGAHFEAVLTYSFLLLLLYLIPEELQPDSLWQMFENDNPTILWLMSTCWILAMSLFAPFYVAGGFALYLTRRSLLEAWDLELMFRRIAPRFKVGQSIIPLVLSLVLITGIALQPTPVAALENDTITREQARQVINKVLDNEAFGKKQTETYWKYIGKSDEKKKEDKSDWNLDWIPQLAVAFEFLLWVGGALLVGWLLIYLVRLGRYKPLRKSGAQYVAPSVLFGLPVTPESLPQDIASAIHALLAEQRIRAALSLLYRATLVHLIHDHHLRIPESATEGECQRIVTGSRPDDEAGFFSRLTRAWMWCAYGDAMPDKDEINALVGDWQRIYGALADA